MKGLLLSLGLGILYCTLESVIYEAINNVPLDGDTRLAFFFIGFIGALFTADRLHLLW